MEDWEFFIENVENNMKKCDVGIIYGSLYESGYRKGVSDVLEMIKEKIRNKNEK